MVRILEEIKIMFDQLSYYVNHIDFKLALFKIVVCSSFSCKANWGTDVRSEKVKSDLTNNFCWMKKKSGRVQHQLFTYCIKSVYTNTFAHLSQYVCFSFFLSKNHCDSLKHSAIYVLSTYFVPTYVYLCFIFLSLFLSAIYNRDLFVSYFHS